MWIASSAWERRLQEEREKSSCNLNTVLFLSMHHVVYLNWRNFDVVVVVGSVATLGVPGTNLQKPEPYELPPRPHHYNYLNKRATQLIKSTNEVNAKPSRITIFYRKAWIASEAKMVYESDFYTTRRPYTRPIVSSYSVTVSTQFFLQDSCVLYKSWFASVKKLVKNMKDYENVTNYKWWRNAFQLGVVSCAGIVSIRKLDQWFTFCIWKRL